MKQTKITILLITILALSTFSVFIQTSKADSFIGFGGIDYSDTTNQILINQMGLTSFNTSIFTSDKMYVVGASARLCTTSSGAYSYVKMLILDSSRHIIATSDTMNVRYSDLKTYNFTFPEFFTSNYIILDGSGNETFYIALVPTGYTLWYARSYGAQAVDRQFDSSNSYEYPTDPTDSFSISYALSAWLYLLPYNEQAPPTATPTPSVTTQPQPTADTQITEFTNDMINFIVPLCLLLLPAVIGAWALGKSGAAKWGFIAGLNIGAILSYLYLDAFGIWAIIIIVVVDVVLVFSSSRGGE